MTDARSERNADLLSRLYEAKAAHGPAEQWKDLLRDPCISKLVNELVLLNEAWLHACVKREKAAQHLREPLEDLEQTAVAGKGGEHREVSGMMGAILKYDFGKYGVSNFTPFIRKAIHDALTPTPSEVIRATRVTPLAEFDGKSASWVDHGQRRPERVAISKELLGVLEEAIQRLPGDRRVVAEYVLGEIRETGQRPSAEMVGQNHNPPVTKARGAQLLNDTFDRLAVEIGKLCPDLAESGIGGWREFDAVFGRGHRVKQGVGV